MTTVKARALEDVDVKLISLVKRGANGEPFSITKAENTKDKLMLDLGNHFSRLKKSATPALASVSYVAIAKSADLDAVKDKLKDTGLSFDSANEVEGGTIFKQSDNEIDANDIAVIQVNDDVTFGVKGVKKEFSTFAFESEVFADVMSQEGIFPSLRIAEDALHTTIMNILYNDPDGPAEAAKKVGKACNDFKNYVVGMIGGLPEQVFKADEALGGDVNSDDVAEIENEAASEPDATEDVEKSMGMADGKDDKKKKKKKEDVAAIDTAAETDTSEADAEEVETEEVEKSAETETSETDEAPVADEVEAPEPQEDPVLKAVAALTDNVTKQFAALDGKIEVVNKRVDDTVRKMDGAVLGEIDSDDEETQDTAQSVSKAADDIAFIDTGLTAVH